MKYASGAKDDYNNTAFTQAAAWYGGIDDSGNTTKTQDVRQKPPGGDGLGAFDITGNGGGSWFNTANHLQVGNVYSR